MDHGPELLHTVAQPVAVVCLNRSARLESLAPSGLALDHEHPRERQGSAKGMAGTNKNTLLAYASSQVDAVRRSIPDAASKAEAA